MITSGFMHENFMAISQNKDHTEEIDFAFLVSALLHSYFLTRSLPDEYLSSLASDNNVLNFSVLIQASLIIIRWFRENNEIILDLQMVQSKEFFLHLEAFFFLLVLGRAAKVVPSLSCSP